LVYIVQLYYTAQWNQQHSCIYCQTLHRYELTTLERKFNFLQAAVLQTVFHSCFLHMGYPNLPRTHHKIFSHMKGIQNTYMTKNMQTTYVMTYVPISMLEFLHVYYRDNFIFST